MRGFPLCSFFCFLCRFVLFCREQSSQKTVFYCSHSLHNRLLANTIENDHKRPFSLGFSLRALCSTKNCFLFLVAVSAQPKSVYDCSSRSLLNQRAFSIAHFMNSITLCLLKTFRFKNFCKTVLSKQMLMRVLCVCFIC